MFKVGSYLRSVFGSAAVLALCYLCEQRGRERFTHGAHSHPWQPSFHRSTFMLHHNYSTWGKKSCIWHVLFAVSRIYCSNVFLFFFNLTVHLRVTVIVRVVSLRLADGKITAANIQMVSLLKLWFMAQAPIPSRPCNPFNISAQSSNSWLEFRQPCYSSVKTDTSALHSPHHTYPLNARGCFSITLRFVLLFSPSRGPRLLNTYRKNKSYNSNSITILKY